MTGAIIAIPVVMMATGTATGIAVSRFRRPRRRADAIAPASPAAVTAVTAGVVAPFAAPANTGHDPDNIAACEREP